MPEQFLYKGGGRKEAEKGEPKFTPPILHFSQDAERIRIKMKGWYTEMQQQAIQYGLAKKEDRTAYVDSFLGMLKESLEASDHEKIIAALEALGAAITSVFQLHPGESNGHIPGAQIEHRVYQLNLERGTSGQRIFVQPVDDEEKGKGVYLYLLGQVGYSDKILPAMELLFGDRLKHVPNVRADSEMVFIVLSGEDTLMCPCGSEKKFKQCHGA